MPAGKLINHAESTGLDHKEILLFSPRIHTFLNRGCNPVTEVMAVITC
jgi:hypothetical protein